jgi:VIT family
LKARRVLSHAEHHSSDRIGWLRAVVLGANDGIVSTASLVLGVAAAGADHRAILLTSVSGLIAGAMSMAAGEFVSVHSQRDTENAALAQERAELKQNPADELGELARIYVGRGLDQALADQVAAQLMAHDALGAHARDELGFSDTTAARPTQAALASAASFAVGRLWPFWRAWVLCRLGSEVRRCGTARGAWPSGALSRWRSPQALGPCLAQWPDPAWLRIRVVQTLTIEHTRRLPAYDPVKTRRP